VPTFALVGNSAETLSRREQNIPITFVPTQAQWRYLRAYLDPHNVGSIRDCARRASVNRRTVYDWLEDERFCSWFHEQTRRQFLHQLPAMWAKCIELACQGSPEHIKLIAMRTGELSGPGTHDHNRVPPPAAATAVFINVPRPQLLQDDPGTPRETAQAQLGPGILAGDVTEDVPMQHEARE